MQAGTIQPGQNVVIIDDVVATGERHLRVFQRGFPFSILSIGGSAAAAGELVAKQGAKTIEYLFIIEASSLNPRFRLDAPVYSVIQVSEINDDTTVDSGRDIDI